MGKNVKVVNSLSWLLQLKNSKIPMWTVKILQFLYILYLIDSTSVVLVVVIFCYKVVIKEAFGT